MNADDNARRARRRATWAMWLTLAALAAYVFIATIIVLG